MGPRLKALLDTHTALWVGTDSSRLSASARNLLADPGLERWVSSVSILEMSIKHRLGKLPEAGPMLANQRQAFAVWAASELAMTASHANLAGALGWDYRDPFDRVLASQALAENLTLISKDRAFDAVPGLRRIW
jgi:PIN domain nuclease of toxin-antitoxin system